MKSVERPGALPLPHFRPKSLQQPLRHCRLSGCAILKLIASVAPYPPQSHATTLNLRIEKPLLDPRRDLGAPMYAAGANVLWSFPNDPYLPSHNQSPENSHHTPSIAPSRRHPLGPLLLSSLTTLSGRATPHEMTLTPSTYFCGHRRVHHSLAAGEKHRRPSPVSSLSLLTNMWWWWCR